MAVRQKKKRGPITVESDWDWDWKDQQVSIHLLARASLDDWKKLVSLPEGLQDGVFRRILSEVKSKVKDSDRNLQRGLSRDEFNFVQKMKLIALFTSEIIRSHSDTDFHKKLVEKCGQNINSRGKKSDPKIHELTAFVLDQIFAKEKIKYSIRRNWAEDPDNFRRTYLDWSKVKKNFDFYFMGQPKNFDFYFMIHRGMVCDEFKLYIKRSENPLKVFDLFFKERSYLMEMRNLG
jgi:2-succinyl-5-enolpyruvyl-6-hydroxy-3-cyclohexene-1-carboxylate synthase